MGARSGRLCGPKSMTEKDAAVYGCGVLHVRDRAVIRVQLCLIVCREGPVLALNELGRRCRKIYLCHTSSAVCKGLTTQFSVSVRNARRLLCTWGKVAY